MADRFEHPHEHDDAVASADRFADALDLCRLAWDTQKTKARLIKLRAAKTELAAAKAEAVEILAKAESDAKAIRDEAQQRLEAADARLEAAESAEEQIALRERRITQLEQSWRYIGEPADVLSGFRAPEHTPLQKARLGHGQQPGRGPDVYGFAEPDAAPAVEAIDALIRRDVGTETTDVQGNAFVAPSTLTRSTEHKRKSAA